MKIEKMNILKKRVLAKIVEGFTLIELIIVIAIIAILASIAIPQYMRYQEKAKVSSYALPVARGCAMDIISYCIENPDETVQQDDLPNCKNSITTTGGTVNLNCTYCGQKCVNGTVHSNGTEVTLVTAQIAGIDSYKAKCIYKNNSVQCSVE